MEQIAGERDDVWSEEAKKPPAHRQRQEGISFPPKFSPQLAVLAERPPTGDQWLHEIKFDGYRMLARIKSGDVIQLITRNGLDWTEQISPHRQGTEQTESRLGHHRWRSRRAG